MKGMLMAEKIGQLVQVVLSELSQKCERCRIRPQHNGRAWCRKCQNWWYRHENKEKTQQELANMLGLRYFRAKLYHLTPELLKKFQTLMDDEGVMLWGDIGCGKSYAMSALARRFYVSGWNVRFMRWYELTLDVRQYNNATNELELLKPYWLIDKLFIDDLGVTVSKNSQESEHSLRTLELILDKRLANYLPTFITSNRSVEDLAKTFDERVASRIIEACTVIQTKGKDRRIGVQCQSLKSRS